MVKIHVIINNEARVPLSQRGCWGQSHPGSVGTDQKTCPERRRKFMMIKTFIFTLLNYYYFPSVDRYQSRQELSSKMCNFNHCRNLSWDGKALHRKKK